MNKARRMGIPPLVFAASALGGCTAVIDQSSFFPQAAAVPQGTLTPPADYVVTDRFFDLPSLGRLHAVRLDNPASEATVIYSGGNGQFVGTEGARAGALAKASGADIILYDYPGRGGTTVPATIDASIATGSAMVEQFRAAGWIGSGPLFAYGLSFGGSQAAAMVRSGGFAGLMIEGSAADIARVGRNFVPGIVRPFVRLRVDPELRRFDYLGYASAAKLPVLLLSSAGDTIVRPANIRDFADQLRARQVPVTLVNVPGGHGTALRSAEAQAAVARFVAEHAR